jgi:sugar (pentulose or hexulose) kinase
MTGEIVAVLDVGKTNTKIAFVDARSGAEIWSAVRGNRALDTPLGQQLDLHGIERWLTATVRQAPHKERLCAIVPIAHGAAAVLLDQHGAVLAAPDYEDKQFESVREDYEAERDVFEDTLSPSLSCGLNLARQLFFVERQHPDLFARVAHILLYPQYWAWRLSGVAASEITSLGCHTDLWTPTRGTFSNLATRHGWARLFPPLRFGGDSLGKISPAFAGDAGLPAECRVVCGIHDSNASYLQHLVGRTRNTPFIVISSGTWTIVMASGADPCHLQAERDMLANVDAFASIVCTARFMGGREYELIAGSAVAPDQSALSAVLQRQAMALPSFTHNGPFSSQPGKVVNADNLRAAERAALATLYLALMSDVLIENLHAEGDLIVDGPLAANPLFAPLLAAMRRSQRVFTGAARAGTANAACYLAGFELPSSPQPVPVAPLQIAGLDAYRLRWRSLLPGKP